MKEKRVKMCLIIGFVLLLISGLLLYFNYRSVDESDKIPEDYIAVFHGGAGEVTYSTYIYKIDNDQANYGFKYINTTNTTKYWGSSDWNIKITKKGNIDWTDGVFTVAKENNAYSYVTVPGSNETYTIEEFQSMFIIN